MALGGWLLMRVVVGAIDGALGNYFYLGAPPQLFPFYLVAGIILVVGVKPLAGIVIRLFTTNWLRVIIEERRRRLNRPD